MDRNAAETGSAEDHRAQPEKPLGRDERVSFYPMQPEEVLRKLLRTSPLDEGKLKPGKKRRET